MLYTDQLSMSVTVGHRPTVLDDDDDNGDIIIIIIIIIIRTIPKSNAEHPLMY